MNKQAIINALQVFINQRPGLEYGNYGDPVSYRAEVRSIGKDLTIARTLLRAVELRDSITAEMILDAAKSGRLSITEKDGKVDIDYCVGQYWCTEYRPAVSRLLSSVLWAWWRNQCMPAPVKHVVCQYGNGAHSKPVDIHAACELLNQCGGPSFGYISDMYRKPGSDKLLNTGDYLRNTAQREFGRGIASRFFN
jgi:hypothetical protein